MSDLKIYQQELTTELQNILQYWMQYTIDVQKGGFYGSVDNDNKPINGSSKGIVLNARILWAFSAAYNFTQDKKYLLMAARAHHYINQHFVDQEYAGVYWSVDADGVMLNGRKQIYGNAFCLYGLSEYYLAVNDPVVLETAIAFFGLIEDKSFDEKRKGYFEAFDRDWQPLNDLRLSPKDANEKKTMNTHLHIIEAYANLYRAWPDDLLKERIVQLLDVFDEYMIDEVSGHLILFFDEEWNAKPNVISYGHDIEAAWLLQQCAEMIGDTYRTNKMKQHALRITAAAMEGMDTDGSLWYEYEPQQKIMRKEKHWWPQAEAMVGFFNAYQLTGDSSFLEHSFNSWAFAKKYLLDKKSGEWFWGVKENTEVMATEDKAGFWKCPYHNSRACMEIIKRIHTLSIK